MYRLLCVLLLVALLIPVLIPILVAQTEIGIFISLNYTDVNPQIMLVNGSEIYLAGSIYRYDVYDRDAFIAKLDSNWNLLWFRVFGGGGLDEVLGGTIVGDSIYLTGCTSIGAGDFDIFVAKFDSNGNLLWFKTFGGTYNDEGDAIVAFNGSLYLVGSTLSFGFANWYFDAFIAKLDLDGNLIWFKTFGFRSADEGAYKILFSPDGYIYVIGWTNYDYSYSSFLAKFDQDGGVYWVKKFSTWVGGFTVSPDGYIYVAGDNDEDALIAKLDKDGNVVWSKLFGGSNFDGANQILIDVMGNIFTAGVTLSFVNYGGVFVAIFDPNGGLKQFKLVTVSSRGYVPSVVSMSAVACIPTVAGTNPYGCGGRHCAYIIWGYNVDVGNVPVSDVALELADIYPTFITYTSSDIVAQDHTTDTAVYSLTPTLISIYGVSAFTGFVCPAPTTIRTTISVTIHSVNFTIPAPEFPTQIGLVAVRPGLYSPQSLLILALFLGVFVMYSKLFGWAQALAVSSAISLAISIALLGTELVSFFLVLLVLGLVLWRVLGK